ncbi:MAG: fructose-specific PTS transporter subunit EIIC [Corynebacterium sp.]|nr:fructose-specific PTS transporter subunit EIIC [Corynebacterium sp.]
MSTDVITPELVALDVDFGTTPQEVIPQLAQILVNAGRATDGEQLAKDALAREAKSGTGVPGGIAIPHCRSEAITIPTLGFARLSNMANFSAPDGDADIVFLIGAPAGGGKEHLKILSKLARALVKKDFVESLRNAATKEEVVELVLGVVNAKPTAANPTAKAAEGVKAVNIVAVTACPTGIAHTYMAADALTQAAQEMDNVNLSVEPQGSGKVVPLDDEIIKNADAVIFATDVGVRNKERFAGKPVIESAVRRGIDEPRQMLEEAIAAASNPNAHRVPAGGGSENTNPEAEGSSLGWGKRIQQAVMTGVSYMVPFVAAGGLLLALGFLFGGYDMANGYKDIVADYSLTNLPGHVVGDMTFDRSGFLLYFGAVLFAIGQAAMGFVVAALSGYISFALAGRPGIAPGFVGGAISVTIGAGFIGGLVTGIIAGLICMWISNWAVPRIVQSLMPVVIIPLLGSLITGLLMYLLLGRPLAAIMNGLQDWLSSMSGSSAILLGIILGLMMCFDLGGPVNKAAYLFGTASLSNGGEADMKIMAAVMAAGMVPPIALSIATFMRKNLFTPAEQENGKSSWLLGLAFISEGAIPFAAADPLRVIPATMAGGAVTGALCMALNVGSRAPHGGLFVFFAISPFWGFLLAIIIGVIVAAFLVVLLKTVWKRDKAPAAA